MLDTTIKDQLRSYLTNLRHDITLEASLDDSDKAQELHELVEDIAALSDRITTRLVTDGLRAPAFRIRRTHGEETVTFAAIPMGHEFTSLVLALLQIGGHPPKIEDDVAAQIRGLKGPLRFETYMSLSCQNCPDVVQALNAMAALNPAIEHTSIDGALFQQEVTERNIMTVPQIYLNGVPFASGRMDVEAIIAKLDTGSASRKAEQLSEKAPFEVLIVGAGPAGAAAAVYDARKVFAQGLSGNVSADRYWIQWLSRITFRCLKPRGQNWQQHLKSMCAATRWISQLVSAHRRLSPPQSQADCMRSALKAAP